MYTCALRQGTTSMCRVMIAVWIIVGYFDCERAKRREVGHWQALCVYRTHMLIAALGSCCCCQWVFVCIGRWNTLSLNSTTKYLFCVLFSQSKCWVLSQSMRAGESEGDVSSHLSKACLSLPDDGISPETCQMVNGWQNIHHHLLAQCWHC